MTRVRKTNQVIVLLLAILMVLSACSSGNKEEAAGSSGSTSSPSASTDTGASSPEPEKFEEVKLKVLINWNGSSGKDIADVEMTPIEEVIKEKTGITFDFEYTKGSEAEKINMIFATQQLPDIYTGPAWGQELDTLVKAAKEGQLADLTEKIKQYPNLQKLIQPENAPAGLYDKALNAYDGKVYILYMNHPATPDEAAIVGHSFYIRKDVANKLGVDPQSIKTPEQFYQLLKQIKDLNLEHNGQKVIPLGGYHSGWPLHISDKMFYPAEYFEKNGRIEAAVMTEEYEQYVLFNRKLVEEGLVDWEAYTQTSEIALEKVNQGRIAVLGSFYEYLYLTTQELVAANPEMEYVPLGPLVHAGAPDNSPAQVVAQGSNVVAIPANSKNVDAALRFLDYVASDEGYKLTTYGIEGMHYDVVDGKPVINPDFFQQIQTDPKAIINAGIGIGFNCCNGQNRMNAIGGDISKPAEFLEKKAEVFEILFPNGIELLTGYDPYAVLTQAPNWETLAPAMNMVSQVYKEAIFAKSDEAALDLINKLRKQILSSGYEEAITYMNKQLEGKKVNTVTWHI